MWDYMNVSKPPEKKLKTKEDTLTQQQKYVASSRNRTFQEAWLMGRPWLIRPEGEFTDLGMRCLICCDVFFFKKKRYKIWICMHNLLFSL